MRRCYLIIEQDDLWYIRLQGKTYGGYLTLSRALRHAVSSAEKSRTESYVMLQQPSGEPKLLWSRCGTGENLAARRARVSLPERQQMTNRSLPPPPTDSPGVTPAAIHPAK